MALEEVLKEAGHEVMAVYAGAGQREALPEYFTDFFKEKVKLFQSPYFLRTPNRKGIYVGRTILFNLFRALRYLREVRRLRREIDTMAPQVVFNFYDVVGSLALKKAGAGIKRVGIGHHFFLHLNGYACGRGFTFHRWLLKMHTKIIMRSCDRIFALSFSQAPGSQSIEVIPPLIRRRFRELTYSPGKRFLVYLLREGYVFDLIRMGREDPGFEADVFTAFHPDIEIPEGIQLHAPDDEKFSDAMASCKGLITTAGFDTVAEAAYHGLPLLAVPSQHHFEQRCNGADIERNGIGMVVQQLDPGVQHKLKSFENITYRDWVDQAAGLILKCMSE
jgi:uncharacterized protein (TIGR00661 family)